MDGAAHIEGRAALDGVGQAHAAADVGGVEGLHGVEVAVLAVVGGLVGVVDEVAEGLDGVGVEAGNHRPPFLVVEAAPEQVVVHELVGTDYPSHVYSFGIHEGAVEVCHGGRHEGGALDLDDVAVGAFVGGEVHRAYLIIDVLLVDVECEGVGEEGVAQSGGAEDVPGVGGVVGEGYLVVVDVVGGCAPVEDDAPVGVHVGTQVAGRCGWHHVFDTYLHGHGMAHVAAPVHGGDHEQSGAQSGDLHGADGVGGCCEGALGQQGQPLVAGELLVVVEWEEALEVGVEGVGLPGDVREDALALGAVDLDVCHGGHGGRYAVADFHAHGGRGLGEVAEGIVGANAVLIGAGLVDEVGIEGDVAGLVVLEEGDEGELVRAVPLGSGGKTAGHTAGGGG